MRIGIVPCLDERAGGVYQYSLTMLDALLDLQKEGERDTFVIFTDDLHKSNLKRFKNAGWEIVPLYRSTPMRLFVRRLIKNTVFEELASRLLNLFRRRESISLPIANVYKATIDQNQRNWFLAHNVELMIYPTSNILSFKTMLPYIFTVHDLNHRIYSEFPEVSSPDEWKGREYVFSNGIRNATLILVDSEIGKEDVLRFYKNKNIQADRIKILPFLYANSIKDFDKKDNDLVRKLFKLPSEYIFYPAQFWSHKNHLRLIKALGMLKDKYKLRIPIVLCGSHSGTLRKKTYDEVIREVKKQDLNKDVYYLGYVEDKYMPALYKSAKALVMATFFGPTNIPILEAWSLKCPAVTSDIRGVSDQAGEAALLVDPKSVESIAAGIKKIWTDHKFRDKLVKSGEERLKFFTQKDYNLRLKSILHEAKSKIPNSI